ncbi:hypothetical protein DRE_04668 [Drechslerella stenobrocha 248]|uniref:Apple domain-containing protein n=1 Tax=Drechslerella stenobrocha 248 TaxID=1043628 RepID=W7HSB2_9PEZI|nr:hypothetical protein DRE_04668 [Drechslerella stenobrocha 248]
MFFSKTQSAAIFALVTALSVTSVIGAPAASPQDFTDDFFRGLPNPQPTGAPLGSGKWPIKPNGAGSRANWLTSPASGQKRRSQSPGLIARLPGPMPVAGRGGSGTRISSLTGGNKCGSVSAPSGYNEVFNCRNGATEGVTYLTYEAIKCYDPSLCAKGCDKILGCYFFNLYIEREPGQNDLIKCSYYAAGYTAASATNIGQERNSVTVTICQSNGYLSTKAIPPVDGYAQQQLGGAINGVRAANSDPDPYMGLSLIMTRPSRLCSGMRSKNNI